MAGISCCVTWLVVHVVVLCATVETSCDLGDVVVIVRSQPNTYHAERAEIFKKHIAEQLTDVQKENRPSVHLLHKTWPQLGTWTVVSLIPNLAEKFSSNSWIIFCEEETRINLKGLEILLKTFDSSQEHFLGQALQDSQAVITHHFAFHENPSSFSYPDFAAGFLLSVTLVTRLAREWDKRPPRIDFTIDPQHELAMYLWNQGKGVRLTDVPELCAGRESPQCVTSYPLHFPQCGNPIPKDQLFIAVKTCGQFHKDRVPVVKKTWYKEAGDIEFYSDVEDQTIPTVTLGIPNTERGHCGKTLAILRRFFKDPVNSKKSWLLIADDDTIISIPRLRELLACYNPDEPVALGERYAYGAVQGYGYDYITGGGGMVFSRLAVHQLMDSSLCSCPANNSPDDMTLGMCLNRLAIPVTHSPLFHQARPDDYSVKLLSHQRVVSFHKHWMVDPIKVYREWFEEDRNNSRDEL